MVLDNMIFDDILDMLSDHFRNVLFVKKKKKDMF